MCMLKCAKGHAYVTTHFNNLCLSTKCPSSLSIAEKKPRSVQVRRSRSFTSLSKEQQMCCTKLDTRLHNTGLGCGPKQVEGEGVRLKTM